MSHTIIESCIGCSLCAKHCPVDAISGNLKEKYNINKIRCIDCGVCGNICPKNAVLDANNNIAKKIPKKNWIKPIIDGNECSSCSMCVDVCKFECLQITKPQSKGDLNTYAHLEKPKDCVGCSMCSNICPLHAITMKGGE